MTSGFNLKGLGARLRRSADRNQQKEAFQPVGLDQNFTGHPRSFDPKIVDEPLNALDNVEVYHPVAACPVDALTGHIGTPSSGAHAHHSWR